MYPQSEEYTNLAFYCSNLTKDFSAKDENLVALKEISFSVTQGEFVCIVGPSGCGKTTLLRIIAGLIPETSGAIQFNIQDNSRPKTAMVFQDQGLLPWMTILDNVSLGLEMKGLDKAERNSLAKEFLDKIGLQNFLEAYPHTLSGGMKQRAAIARAFLTDPEILLMDEPFGMLDAQTRIVMQEELLNIWQERRHTVIYITHDIEEAIYLSDKILVMSGRPSKILEDIPIDFGRPRDRNAIVSKSTEIRLHIWGLLHDEVVRDMERSDV